MTTTSFSPSAAAVAPEPTPGRVPFFDLAPALAELRPQLDAALARVASSGWYIAGRELEAFEADFARFVGGRECIGVANGLDALTLALRALDVQPGDEVIVPSNTFVATWLAVTAVGARPVPVEPDEATYNIDPDRLEAAITPRTRVVVPVHLYGQPAPMDEIRSIADRHGLRVLEDAAQAHGARYRGRRIGTGADVVAWSFYPTKNLGAMGDAGAVTTDDPSVAARIRRLRNYGSSERYVHEERGVNSRLDEIQAAVLRAKLPHLDDWNARRAGLAAIYAELLRGGTIAVPHVPSDVEPVWHLYVVRVPDREVVRERLGAAGVDTLIHYPIPPHLQRAYADLGYRRGDFPIAERLASEILSLPMGPHLAPDAARRAAVALQEAVQGTAAARG